MLRIHVPLHAFYIRLSVRVRPAGLDVAHSQISLLDRPSFIFYHTYILDTHTHRTLLRKIVSGRLYCTKRAVALPRQQDYS